MLCKIFGFLTLCVFLVDFVFVFVYSISFSDKVDRIVSVLTCIVVILVFVTFLFALPLLFKHLFL